MFVVEEKGTMRRYKVYAVLETHFMFYVEEDDCWFFGEIDRYRPVEEG